ncbi:CST complex subunit CTC1 [Larimichthys crocea]|nr:CST complex subunit CTC1 [Larimichthys crocea]
MMHLGLWAVSREQRCIVGQVKGHVVCFLFLQLQWSCSLCGSLYIQVCDSDDSLLHFLLCVCSSDVVCRQLSLTCRKHNNPRSEEMKRFSRGERDFMTRMTRPLQLTCLHINTD